MYCIGLTGSIASGKSTVAHYFREKNIAVYSADEFSRELTQKGEPAWKAIIEHFGDHVITTSGELNRALIRQIIFASPSERQWLEDLLHPLIRKTIEQKLATPSTSPYYMIEIPLLKNRKESYSYLNRVLLVTSHREEQIRRVRQRDKLSEEEAVSILNIQPKHSEEEGLVDDFLVNDGTKKELLNKVEMLHEKYLVLARQAQNASI